MLPKLARVAPDPSGFSISAVAVPWYKYRWRVMQKIVGFQIRAADC
jgi:hypothetical protein